MIAARRLAQGLKAALVLLTGFCAIGSAAETGAPPRASMVTLLTRDLGSAPDKEVVMLTVTYPGGTSSLPHRHDAQVFVYVLEGRVTMQVRGSAAVTLAAGGTFYEAPEDVHIVSENSDKQAPAKILVVMIKDKSKPISRLTD